MQTQTYVAFVVHLILIAIPDTVKCTRSGPAVFDTV